MILLSTILNKFRAEFLAQYQSSVLPGHKKALWTIPRCRQEHGPHMLAQCTDHTCGAQTYIPHSCGHRNCPHCQSHESKKWIDKQLSKLLPAAPYFLITFTIPRELRDLSWRNQKTVYSLLFSCVQDTLKTFTGNDKRLGGEAGFTAILHTHARNLSYHPHIHVLMPGASIDKKAGLWKKKGAKYLFSHKALAKVFRAKLLQSMVDQELVVPKDCPKQWVVDCKSVGNGSKAIIYLGRYLYRGVIQEKDILTCKDGMVTFRYLHAKSGKYRTRTVSGHKFLYLLMLHVLPKGFRRARCYGFLHPCSKSLIQFLQLLLRVSPYTIIASQQTQRPSISCPVCGAKMKIVTTRLIKPPSARLKPCCN